MTGAQASNYTVAGITLPATIPPGGSATFTATFQGTSIQVYNAEVVVNNNDCNEAVYNYAVRAEISCVAASFTACPSAISTDTDPGLCSAVVSYPTTATGTPAPTIAYNFTGATIANGSGTGSGSTFNKGVTNVVITASNGCANNAICSFTVTVADNQPPVISCPAPLAVQCAAEVPAVNINSVTFSDNCSAIVTHTGDIISNQICTNRYTITRTYKATDPSGNFATCTQTITVDDQTAPVITSIPANVTVSCALEVPAANTTAVVASDNCSGAVTITSNDVITAGSCANR